MKNIYDFVGIGLGPFNLGLACLSEPIEGLNCLFVDQNETFDWHPGMMLDGVSLQTPFMSDLVTLADPTHPLSFLNYIKQKGDIYSFYIKESFFLLREQYNQYCQWAVQQLNNVQFNTRVELIEYDAVEDCYQLLCVNRQTGQEQRYYAKKLVLGTGPAPYIPDAVEAHENIIHSGQYLQNKKALQQAKHITVVGSGQSAAEIFYELLQESQHYNYQLNWATRAPRFFPLEYTKLTLEMTSPEYVDYFYALPHHKREQLIAQQKQLYKGINSSLINEIYDLLYQLKVTGEVRADLFTNSELVQCDLPDAEQSDIELTFQHHEQQKSFNVTTEKLVMATGFCNRLPDFLNGLVQHINWDEQGRFAVDRYYSIDKQQRIFVQNAELHTHGFVTPDLGMACYRNSHILRQITGKEVYPIEQQIAFQTFGAPQGSHVTTTASSKAHYEPQS